MEGKLFHPAIDIYEPNSVFRRYSGRELVSLSVSVVSESASLRASNFLKLRNQATKTLALVTSGARPKLCLRSNGSFVFTALSS